MLSRRVERLTSSLIRDILAAAQQPGVISFAGGLPDPDTLMWPTSFDAPVSLAQYGPSEGEMALREAIAARAQTMGIRCEAQDVLILSGSQQGIDLVSKLFIDPETPIITESPTYLAALQSFQFFGADITGLPVRPDGVEVADLAQALAARDAAFAYLIPTFQNPSASCYSAEKRRAMADLLKAARVPLIEDDPYRELAYEAVDRRPICADMGPEDAWVYLGTFSKTLAPGLRVGYLIASPVLFGHLLRLKQASDLHTNRLGQWLTLQTLQSGGYDAHLQALAERYRHKRDAMQAALQAELGEMADWTLPVGGLFFWLTLKHKIDTRQLLKPALESGLAFMPGEPFYPERPAASGTLRLNFSHASAEQMQIGVARLAKLLREHR